MAINPLTYTKNVMKSLAYTTVDVVKDMNPALQNFAEANDELSREVYSAVKDYKNTIKNAKKSVVESETFRLIGVAKNNLLSDLKTGKFYNVERINSTTDNIADSILNSGDDDWEFNDDFDFDDNDTDDDKMFNDMNAVSKAASNAVTEATIRSADYVAGTVVNSSRMISHQNKEGFARINLGIASLNSNILSLSELKKPMLTHINNSAAFYKNQTESMNKVVSLLETISKNQESNMVSKKKDVKTRKDFSYITSGGMPDLKKYAEVVKQNIKNSSGGLGSMNDMFGEGTSVFESLIASPWQFMLEGVVKKALPNAIKKGSSSLNNTMQGLFGSLISKLNTKSKNSDSGGIFEFVKKIFGIETGSGSGIDPAKYEKGKVDFDGITRKSIVEVIPTYLAKILSAVSGEPETRYDFKAGKFVKMSAIKSRKHAEDASYRKNALSDLDTSFRENLKNVAFDTRQNKEDFYKDLEVFYENLFENDGYFDYKNLKDTTVGQYGISNKNFNLIRKLFAMNDKNGKRGINTNVAGNVLSAKSSKYHNNAFIETYGDDILLNLLNGSAPTDKNGKALIKGYNEKEDDARQQKQFAKVRTQLFTDDEGRDIFFYLKDYYEQIGAINQNLMNLGGGTGKITDSRNASSKFINKRSLPQYQSSYAKKETEDNAKLDKEFQLERERILKNQLSVDLKNVDYSDWGEAVYAGGKTTDYVKDVKHSANHRKVGLIEQLIRAKNIQGKAKVIMEGLNDLSQKPSEILAATLTKTDQRIYDFIFGKNETSEDDDRSFMERMQDKLYESFDHFNQKIDDNILTPLQEKMEDSGFNDLKKNIKEFFFGTKEGDVRSGGMFGDLIQNTVGAMKEYLGLGKDAIVETLNPITSQIHSVAEAKRAKRKENAQKKQSEITSARIREAHENTDPLRDNSEDYNNPGSVTTKSNIHPLWKEYEDRKASRYNKMLESLNSGEAFDKSAYDTEEQNDYESTVSQIGANPTMPGYALGGKVTKTGVIAVTGGEYIIPAPGDKKKQLARENEAKRRFFNTYGKNKFFDKGNFATGGSPSINPDGTGEVKSEKNDIGKNIIGHLNTFFKDLTTAVLPDKQEESNFSKAATTFVSEAYDNAPNLLAGGLLGGGFSLLTGMVGGPLLGAAVGAGTALISKSTKIQDALFGKTDEDGKHTEGLLGDQVTEFIKKKLPTIVKTGLTGTVLGTLGVAPGGPVGGLILGSAFGYVKQNSDITSALFGSPEKYEDFQNKVKKAMPAMGVGAIASTLLAPALPGGLATKVILGSVLGFASQTDKMKTLLFGKEGEDGKREGGLKGLFVDKIIDPAKNGVVEIIKSTKDRVYDLFNNKKNGINVFFKKHFTDPLKKRLKVWMKDKFDKAKKTKAGQFIGKVGSKIGGGLKKVGSFINPLTMPSRLIQGVGRHMTSQDIIKGRNRTMTAADRMEYIDQYGTIKQKGAYALSNAKDLDRTLAGMNDSAVGTFGEASTALREGVDEKSLAKKRTKLISNLVSTCKSAGISDLDINKIRKLIDKGDPNSEDSFMKIVSGYDIDQDTLTNLQNTFRNTMKDFTAWKGGVDDAKKGYKYGKSKFNKVTGAHLSKKGFRRAQSAIEIENDLRKKSRSNIEKRAEENGETVLASTVQKETPKVLQDQLSETKSIAEMLATITRIITKGEDGDIDGARNTFNTALNNSKKKNKKNKSSKMNPDGTGSVDFDTSDENNPKGSDPMPNTPRAAFGGLVTVTAGEKVVSPSYGLLRHIADAIDSKFKQNYVTTSDGKIIKLTTGRDGDVTYDMRDKDTIDTLRDQDKRNGTQESIAESLKSSTGLLGKLGSLFGGKKNEDGESDDGESGDGGIGSGAIGKGIAFLTGAKTLLSRKNLLGSMGTVALYSGALDKPFDNFSTSIGESLGYDPTDTGLSGENGENGISDQVTKMAVRNLIKGDRLSRMYSHIPGQGLTTKGIGVAEKGIGAVKNKLATVFANSKVGQRTMDSKVGQFIVDKTRKKALQQAEKDAVKTATKTAAKEGAEGGIKDQISTAVHKWIDKVIKKVPEAGQAALENAGDQIVDEAADLATKKGGSEVAESTVRNGTDLMPFLNIAVTLAFAVADFISGYKHASDILGVEDPTTAESVVAGLIKSLNGAIPFVGGLIPEKWIVNVFCETVGKALDMDITKEREAYTLKINKYNEENGTDYDKEEYNNTVKNNKSWRDKTTNQLSQSWGMSTSVISAFFKGKNVKDAAMNSFVDSESKTDSGLDKDGNLIAGYINEDTHRWKSHYKKWIKKGLPRDYAEALYLNECLHDSNYLLVDERIDDFNERIEKYVKSKNSYKIPEITNNYPKMIKHGVIGHSNEKKLKDDFPDIYGKNGTITKLMKGKKVTTNSSTENSGSGSDMESTYNSSTSTSGSGSGTSSSTTNDTSGAGSGLKLSAAGSFISQVSDKYKSKKYGDSTLGSQGCGPAAAAMVINDVAPQAINMDQASQYALAHGYKNKNGTEADYFKDILNKYGIGTQYIKNNDGNNIDTIEQQLKNNKEVILLGQDATNTSKSKSPFGPNNHYVVATGMDNKGNILVNDPESNKPSIRYSKNILNDTKLGISANTNVFASGSGIRRMLNKAYKSYSGAGGTNREQIWAFLESKGLSEIARAAVIGNMMQESGTNCDPTAEQGGHKDITRGSGYGLCQWTYYTRQDNLKSYCSQNGLDYHTLQGQLNFFWYELNTSFPNAYDALKSSTDIAGATRSFCNLYEAPGTPEINSRIKYATDTYNEFTGKNIPLDFTAVNDGTPSETTSDSASTEDGGNQVDSTIDTIGNAIQKAISGRWGVSDAIKNFLGFDTSDSDSTDDTDTSSDSSNATTSVGNTSIGSKIAELANSKIGKIPVYSQDANKRNDIENGSSDCSGFAKWAITNAGGPDPGSYTGAQIKNGTLVDKGTSPDVSKLQPGDLLFYTAHSGDHEESNVGHVEIYTGNNKRVGNGSSGGAHESDITASANRYIEARRYTDSAAGSGLLGHRKSSRLFTGAGSNTVDYTTTKAPKTKVVSTSKATQTNSFSVSAITVDMMKSIINYLSTISDNTSNNAKILDVMNQYLTYRSSTKSNASSTQSTGLSSENQELFKELDSMLAVITN